MNRKNYLIQCIVAVCAIAFLFSACSDSTGPDTEGVDASGTITDIANKVIVATYADLDAKANILAAAVSTLASNATEANLAAAQQAWRNARSPWEQSEGFLFGPVDTKGIDPGIDSWPVNRIDLDAVLAGTATLNKAYIDNLEGTLKGFHTIEYLLFGEGNGKVAADFTPRELEYLIGVTQSFVGEASKLVNSWITTGENYVANLENAGEEGSVYISQKDALQELVNGMIGICDEVANGKISDPFSQQDRTLEESQFSDNSIADFQNNIRSVKNVYLCEFNGNTGEGLTALVLDKNSQLDAKVRTQVDAAITAIGAMQPSFGQAIFTNQASVTAAQNAVLTLQQTLEGELLPLILAL